MSNNETLVKAFCKALLIKPELIIDSLKYNSIPEWDSLAHMALIPELEESFDVLLDTEDIIDMSSVGKAKEILGKYKVDFINA